MKKNYVNKITKNPDKADLQRLVLLLTDQPLLVIIKKINVIYERIT